MRLIFDVPNFFSDGIATITLAQVKNSERGMVVYNGAADLAKGRHYVLDNQGLRLPSDEMEDGDDNSD